jgi:hypothetical protein
LGLCRRVRPVYPRCVSQVVVGIITRSEKCVKTAVQL